MSLAHLRLIRSAESERDVRYRVESPDFSAHQAWDTVGEVLIDRTSGRYEFKAAGPWADEKVIPPHVYAMPEGELEARLQTDLKGFGYGAWTAKIDRWVRRMIESAEYPEVV